VNTALRRSAIVIGLLIGLVLIALLLIEANPPRAWLAERTGQSLGREVEIAGLDIDALSWHPNVTIAELRVLNPEWAGAGEAVRIGTLDVSVDLLELLRGRLVLPQVRIEKPTLTLVREDSGRINAFERKSATAPSKPLDLPVIQALAVHDGRLELKDAVREIHLQAAFEAHESGEGDSPGFILTGEGEMNEQPFELQLASDALANVTPGNPWPFALYVAAVDTQLVALGRIEEAFDLARFEANLDVAGQNLAALYELTGLALPDTPPYSLRTVLARAPDHYSIEGLDGRVGDSDLRGKGTVDLAGARPYLTADLKSKTLDLDDLRTVLGAPPARGPDETISAEQEAMARRMAERDELLPRARLDTAKLHSLDASVRLEAADFRATKLPIRAFRVEVELQDGELNVEPLVVDLESGRAAGRVRLDAGEDPPRTALDLSLSKVPLESLVRYTREEGDAEPALEGLLEGRVKLEGQGNSVYETAGAADGEITLVVPQGAVRRVFAELTGIDVAEALGLLLSGDTQQTGVRCAVAHFAATDGTLALETMVLDTEDVLITGNGKIALGTEQMDLEIEGRPKKPRLIRVRSGITLRGPLRDPELGIEEENLLAQGAIGAALATLVAPVAALLAVVDPGLADDENCSALIAENRREATSPN